jgi:L-ascorbate metabolism protein UlaG (beta-lactamase superfamily)
MRKKNLITVIGGFIFVVIISISLIGIIILNNQLSGTEIIEQDYLYYNNVKITWHGWACFKIKTDDLIIFIDPYDITPEQVEIADIVIVTHHNFDHLSLPDILNVSEPLTTEIYYPDICSANLRDLNSSYNHNIVAPYDNTSVNGISLEFVPSYDDGAHDVAFGLVGVIIDFGETRIFHPGDTDKIPELESINTDIALIPIYNMEEALSMVTSIKKSSDLKYVIPMHFNDIKDAFEFIQRAECNSILLKNL